ncbi:MAG: tadA [Gammaproteobacteria bacterium]|jgi:tRNA(adenine34) deaminase|nr:tadA [Gammaproteobacteria bacterium]MCE3238205.1 tadA [Gammaproteobacteria bacterium]
MISEQDIQWMRHALQLAEFAVTQQEVPVGAVLISDNSIIGEGSNCPIRLCDPTAHAEIIALRQGARHLNNYRLINSTLYVTLEPCMMCVGAIVHARVKRVVYGALDPKAGAIVSAFDIGTTQKLNHKVLYEGGALGKECGQILSDFFQARRG